MKVTKAVVEHVAKLARLGMSEEEKTTLTEQLSRIIEYAEVINKLDTKGVPPTSHAIPMKNVMREDHVVLFPHTDLILNNAPEKEGNMFKVPKILE